MHLAVDSHGMPLRAIITQGTAADCKQATALIDGFNAQHLLADRGYDTNEILCQAASHGMSPVIPPMKTRKSSENMTKDSIKSGTLSKMPFFT